MSVEPGSVCPSCERKVPIPMEEREPRERAQWNLTFGSRAEADSARVLCAAARELLDSQLGTAKRVRDGDIVIAVFHDFITREAT
jgi:hypothetical protein